MSNQTHFGGDPVDFSKHRFPNINFFYEKKYVKPNLSLFNSSIKFNLPLFMQRTMFLSQIKAEKTVKSRFSLLQ